MSASYDNLLDAAIRQLEEMKARGVRWVPVDPAILADLSKAPAPAALKAPGQPAQSTPRFAASVSAAMPAKPNQPMAVSRPASRAPAPVAAASKRTSPPPVVLPGLTSDAPPPGPALSPEAKATAFASLRERALVCTKCEHLASSRKNVVFGVGSPDAELMFVGEAPGADEDAQGEPFVGRAGQLLTKIIQTMGLTRETVYIANILKCRPDTPGQTAGNRKPTGDEMKTCIPYLHEQIDLIRPKVLVALGATAVEGLLGKAFPITKLRGNWQTYRGVPLMPTYHPAFLLRNQSLSVKREVWEDMLQAMEKLGMPISEKQRGFFLKA